MPPAALVIGALFAPLAVVEHPAATTSNMAVKLTESIRYQYRKRMEATSMITIVHARDRPCETLAGRHRSGLLHRRTEHHRQPVITSSGVRLDGSQHTMPARYEQPSEPFALTGPGRWAALTARGDGDLGRAVTPPRSPGCHRRAAEI